MPYAGAGMLAFPLYQFGSFEPTKSIAAKILLTDLKAQINKIGTLLVYKKDDFIEVYDAHCTHMGCILNIDTKNNELICPCHNSKFTLNGEVIKGPATRNLDKITYVLKNDILLVG